MKLRDIMTTQEVTQSKSGHLLINGKQVKILSPRLRNIPLGQWQQEDRMEELRYREADADRAKQFTKEAEVEAVQATVMATLFSAWTRWEAKAGHGDLTFGRFVRDTGVLVPRGTVPTANPMIAELCDRVFAAHVRCGAWQKYDDHKPDKAHCHIVRELAPDESAALDRELDECFTRFRGATA